MSELYFQLQFQNTPFEIHSRKSTCSFEKKNFLELNEKIDTFHTFLKENRDLQDYLAKINQLSIHDTHYIFQFFGFYNQEGRTDPSVPTGYIILDETKQNDPNSCCKFIETKQSSNYKKRNFVEKKFKKMITTMAGDSIYHRNLVNKDYCTRSAIMKNMRLNLLYSLFSSLEKGGDLLIAHIYNICDCDIIEFFYLCALLFEKVTILHFNDFFVYGQNFQYDNRISKEEFKKIISKPFDIQPKVQYDEMIQYLNECALQRIQFTDLLLQKRWDEYLYVYVMDVIHKAENFKIDKHLMMKLQKKLIEIFRNVYIENEFVKIHSAIKGEEGSSIQQLIQKYHLKKCLEIGMAFGISAFYILSSSPDVSLISIDPHQKTDWKSSGVKLIKKMNYDTKHTLITEKSYVAMPDLLQKHGEESFDFIFIDGFHTFDYTLVDVFYAILLVKTGGIILIDDALHRGVAKCVRYIDTNYRFLKKIPSTRTQVAYQKMKNDDREWNFHMSF
jgi:predicted O-methyltransferase YrrM